MAMPVCVLMRWRTSEPVLKTGIYAGDGWKPSFSYISLPLWEVATVMRPSSPRWPASLPRLVWPNHCLLGQTCEKFCHLSVPPYWPAFLLYRILGVPQIPWCLRVMSVNREHCEEDSQTPISFQGSWQLQVQFPIPHSVPCKPGSFPLPLFPHVSQAHPKAVMCVSPSYLFPCLYPCVPHVCLSDLFPSSITFYTQSFMPLPR